MADFQFCRTFIGFLDGTFKIQKGKTSPGGLRRPEALKYHVNTRGPPTAVPGWQKGRLEGKSRIRGLQHVTEAIFVQFSYI